MTTLYRAAIFDMDGTLLDTLDDLAAAVNGALADHDLPRRSREKVRTIIGKGLPSLMRRAMPVGQRKKALFEAVLESARQHYARCWADSSEPYPGVAEMLDGLAGRGVTMGILSNKPDEFTGDMARRLLGDWTFAGGVLGVKPGGPVKPDPQAALEMAAHLGRPPKQVVFVGDSPMDMQTAVAAGMLPVGVSWGFCGVRSLINAGAALILDRPEELLDLRFPG